MRSDNPDDFRYDIYGYLLNIRYDGDFPTTEHITGKKMPNPDPRIPKCKCGCPRESHSPQDGNWLCHGNHDSIDPEKLGHGGYCWNYGTEQGQPDWVEQSGRDRARSENQLSITAEVYHRDYAKDPETAKEKRKSPKKREKGIATLAPKKASGSATPRPAKRARGLTEKTCPRCGEKYAEPPALSRRDNKTSICSACGGNEAMLDVSNLEDIPTSELLIEHNFQKKLGLDYYDWFDWKKGLVEKT